ncbi:unnamed protein product [Dicrocoelium dendriticum]|nr:unnamed protein product [Dicrocoelium dendriticum]CAH8601015.1 unnamed protein product [Dicrocoelium dendriticum]
MVQGDLFVVEVSACTVNLDSHLESSEIGAIVKFLNFQPFEFFRAVESSERNETSVLFDVRCSKSATFRCNSRELQSAFDTTAIYVVVARWPKAADTPRAESNYRFLGLATISLSGIQASLPQNTCGKDNVKVFNVSGTFQLRDVTGRPVGNIDLSICLSRLTESSPIVVHHSTPFDDIASLKRKPFPKADDTVAQPKAEQKRWMSVSVQTTTDRATQVYEHWTIGVPSGGSDFLPKAAYPLDAEEFGLHKKEDDVRFLKRQPRDCDIFMFRQSTNLVDPLDNHLDLGVLQPAPIQLNCTADAPSSSGPHANRPRATKRNRFTASSQRGRIASHENRYHGSSTSESSTHTPIEYGDFSRPAVSERSLACSPLGAPSRPKSCGSHIPARISQLAIPRKRNPASALLVPKGGYSP